MPPEDPPEGCFLVTTGQGVDPEFLQRTRSQGPDVLCAFFLKRDRNEQSRYKMLRAFFPMSFREFKALERRVGDAS
jgi:hypothetical protein